MSIGLLATVPVYAIYAIFNMAYEKTKVIVSTIFDPIEIVTTENSILLILLAGSLLGIFCLLVGWLISTRIGGVTHEFFEKLLIKLPFYETIKNFLKVITSDGKNSLVVLSRSFSDDSYCIGTVNSIKESPVKGYYDILISTSPVPNGGYNFMTNSDRIYVLEGVKYSHYIEYLLSMGTKTIVDIAGIESKPIEEYQILTEWINEKKLIDGE